MATKVLATPGVYIEEKNAFPSSVVAVPTAVPVFIGYTEKAIRGTKSLANVPTRITSLSEYVELFGGAPDTTFTIKEDKAINYTLAIDADTQSLLFASIRLFYSNGGGPCYILSVGSYVDGAGKAVKKSLKSMQDALVILKKEQEPTLVVVPDAVLLSASDCFSMNKAVISHCEEMQSRFAVLDVYEKDVFDLHKDAAARDTLADVIKNFRQGVNLGGGSMKWAAAYYPWLDTTIIQGSEIDYTNISNLDVLAKILTTENSANLSNKFIPKERHDAIDLEIKKLKTEKDITTLSNTLLAVSPIFKDIMKDLQKGLNILPPAAGMVGVYSRTDNVFGVHKAPANTGMVNVIGPKRNLNNEEQEDLNLPLNGLAVNAIRSFVGKGLLVWGARTLDGNSQDWRYINVRRTMIMIEQSIKFAAEAYVFEPNDANTWASMKSMLINFLTNVWRQGALVGATQDDAFRVDLGLGSTMSPNDILDGIMRITVKVAISRPAEFIVITFQQQMQKS